MAAAPQRQDASCSPEPAVGDGMGGWDDGKSLVLPSQLREGNLPRAKGASHGSLPCASAPLSSHFLGVGRTSPKAVWLRGQLLPGGVYWLTIRTESFVDNKFCAFGFGIGAPSLRPESNRMFGRYHQWSTRAIARSREERETDDPPPLQPDTELGWCVVRNATGLSRLRWRAIQADQTADLPCAHQLREGLEFTLVADLRKEGQARLWVEPNSLLRDPGRGVDATRDESPAAEPSVSWLPTICSSEFASSVLLRFGVFIQGADISIVGAGGRVEGVADAVLDSACWGSTPVVELADFIVAFLEPRSLRSMDDAFATRPLEEGPQAPVFVEMDGLKNRRNVTLEGPFV